MKNVVKLFSSENPTALIDRASLTATVELLASLGKNACPTIRFSSEPGGIALTASNTIIQAETSIIADVDARFSAAIPAATLLKLLKKGGMSETVVLELVPDDEKSSAERFIPSQCTVMIGGSSFTIDVSDTDDFPEPIRHDPEQTVHRFDIPAAVLWNAIDGTIGATSTDETRHYLNGIYVYNHDGHARFVATDGHRLYMQDTNVNLGKAEIAGIIPREAATLIAAIIDGYASADPVSVEMSQSVAVAVYRDIAVTLELIDGSFPDYLRVVPTDPEKTATLHGGDFAAAVTSVIDCTGAATVKLGFSSDEVILSAKGATGQGTAMVACKFDGEPFEIGFAAKNLRSVIDGASPDGRKMAIRMADNVSPVLVTGSIGGWTGVLMPAAV
ncbi:MAG TPA: hypothetical protein VK181_04365 [Rhizobium sp.]|nr:hypothetical protein [Rhizobium sp.]